MDLVNGVIYKQAKLYGVTGRNMYKTWYAADEIIKAGMVKVKNTITHRFPLEDIEEALKLAESGNAGKIIIDIA
jgi:threonine 3-dehydrogenase